MELTRARIGWAALGGLGSTGLTVSGLVNPPIAYALLGLMIANISCVLLALDKEVATPNACPRGRDSRQAADWENQRFGRAVVERESPGASQKIARLEKKLRATERERDKLRAFLSDLTAKRQRDEEMLRERCGKLALEVRNFTKGHGSQYENQLETVERFRLRHYDKVTELRDELDRQGWLTAQERESLTLSAHVGTGKIRQIADALRFIAVGH